MGDETLTTKRRPVLWEKGCQVHSQEIVKTEKSMIDDRGSKKGSGKKPKHRRVKST